MNTPDISPAAVIVAPELRLLPRRTNLEGRGKAIKRDASGCPSSHVPFQTSRLSVQPAYCLLFSRDCLQCRTVSGQQRAVWICPSCPGEEKKKTKQNSICPSTAHSAVNSNQWPIVAGLRIHAVLFVPGLTARSLRIQRAVIFPPPFLYLEVNGCQGTNEAARNSCTSAGRLPRDAEGGIKQRAARFLSEGRNNNNGRKGKKGKRKNLPL